MLQLLFALTLLPFVLMIFFMVLPFLFPFVILLGIFNLSSPKEVRCKGIKGEMEREIRFCTNYKENEKE
jgi:hypothetical protein